MFKGFQYTEIISYMVYEVVKSLPESSFYEEAINEAVSDLEAGEDKFFDVIVKNKHYPSCYQYNVLIMLAKRLISEDDKKEESYKVWRHRINETRHCEERSDEAISLSY